MSDALARVLAARPRSEKQQIRRAALYAALVAVASVALLALSGWFLTAAALAAGAGTALAFNYMLPSAAIRLFAIVRTGARYGERLASHDAALSAIARVRPALFAALAATPVAREKKRRGADASRERDAAAPPAKKPKAAESSAGKASAAAAAFVAAKAFGGAKPGYYFRKGAKGLGYYLDANANARKTETAKKEKKSSVFSVPREQAEFQPVKRFSGAKPGFVFKKGARGLGYYLDRPPKVTWKGGGGGGARRGDWARNVGGGRRSGGKNKGGRGGRRF